MLSTSHQGIYSCRYANQDLDGIGCCLDTIRSSASHSHMVRLCTQALLVTAASSGGSMQGTLQQQMLDGQTALDLALQSAQWFPTQLLVTAGQHNIVHAPRSHVTCLHMVVRFCNIDHDHRAHILCIYMPGTTCSGHGITAVSWPGLNKSACFTAMCRAVLMPCFHAANSMCDI